MEDEVKVRKVSDYETSPLWAIEAIVVVSVASSVIILVAGPAPPWLAIGQNGLLTIAFLEHLCLSLFILFMTSLAVFVCFAGIPGLLLFALNFRSWQTAAWVGCVIAFCAGAVLTLMGGLATGPHAAAWLGDKPTMIDGRLTAYGRSVYGFWAALKTGALTSPVGAGVAVILWRIAYRPSRSVSPTNS